SEKFVNTHTNWVEPFESVGGHAVALQAKETKKKKNR
uniref:Uncharacterized protein n=1 Tax=Panthera tigris altaica TaxID=74533 RepID=A0A8C9KG95_PANTA